MSAHKGNIQPQLDLEEHAHVGAEEIGAKKVVVLDNAGNQFLGGGFNLPTYDYFSVATPIDTREIYTFKQGGSGGTTVATVTINYADNTKATITNATMS